MRKRTWRMRRASRDKATMAITAMATARLGG
jgi:hypothetical protein